jgi:hypothetical protein
MAAAGGQKTGERVREGQGQQKRTDPSSVVTADEWKERAESSDLASCVDDETKYEMRRE